MPTRKGLEGPMELITLKRAGEISGISPGTLRNVARKGKLRVRKEGRDNFTTRFWLHQYMMSRSTAHGKANPLPPGYVVPGEEE
jgi:hypothetical protein